VKARGGPQRTPAGDSPKKTCTQCGLKRQLKFFATPKGRVCLTCQRKTRRTTSHGSRILATYGITAEEYAAILRLQGGVCAICGGGRAYNLHVDHSHAAERATGSSRASVRGLLCKRCNSHLLPAAMDDPEILMAAIRYLKSPPAQRVVRVVRRRVVRRARLPA
jgi:Recombination endonuclease VII